MSSKDQNRTVRQLLVVVVCMFGFGFAMVPLYDVLCEITGFNGKTGKKFTAAESLETAPDRVVTIQFLTNNNASMPWEFRPRQRSIEVHPGEMNYAEFYVRNVTGKAMVGQAVPSVTPFRAAEYLHKTECFCFEQQRLGRYEALDMPLRFIIDNDLPQDVKTLTLSYTLFDVTEQAGVLAAN